MAKLTLQEQQEVRRYLDAGEPLPDKFRFLLFDDKREVELVWNGKTDEVCNVVIPFQTIEQVDEPRAEKPEDTAQQADLFSMDDRGRQLKGWTNKLIWGDNKLILSSLKNGPLREEIEREGGIKLIYIDPPFDVGADFSMDVEVGEDTFTKKPNILEEIAYRDTWGKGADSFIAMIYERLVLMRDLLANDGSIYVHCDWRVTQYIRMVMDDIFDRKQFKNEIIWCYKSGGAGSNNFAKKHDTIYYYTKSDDFIFNSLKEKSYMGVGYSTGNKNVSLHDDNDGLGPYTLVNVKDWWNDIGMIATSKGRIYPTQKPEELIERILKSSSNEDDIVADFFSGSGTMAAVAEKLGRKWIVADLGKFAIHATRKRMIDVQRDLKSDGKNYRAFELLNLGKYERQHYVGMNLNLREEQQQKQIEEKEAAFIDLILSAYKAEKTDGFASFHGKKAGRLVVVGPVNMPVSRLFVDEIIAECLEKKITKVDILGFEFEMGLFPIYLMRRGERALTLRRKTFPVKCLIKEPLSAIRSYFTMLRLSKCARTIKAIP